jgi:sulfate/thiosulfate transport system substrate-binding protein
MNIIGIRNRLGRRTAAGLATAGVLVLGVVGSGCGGSDGGSGNGKVELVAYSTPQQAYEQHFEPAFKETDAGNGVEFTNSFGASGDQSRAVEAGQGASYINLSLETDMTRLVEAGIVAESWRDNKYRGISSNSVVVIVTRPGDDKTANIKTFEDVVTDDDIEVVTPNPFTSGGARWNIMAVYGAAIEQGKSEQEALADVEAILRKTPTQPESARVALQTFLGGAGDVLLSYENEAIAAQNAGEDVEYVIPEETLLIETPVAVTIDAPQAARDFLDFVWSDQGQEIWSEQGYRPVNEALLDEAEYPVPPGLFTIDDFGGWDAVATEFFEDGTGSIFKIVQDLGISTG